MQQEKYIDVLLKYNENKITEKEFVDFLNSEEELQKIFNKSLKAYITSEDISVVNRINWEYSYIAAGKEQYTLDHHSANRLSIHFYVKQLIAKKYFNYLNKQDADRYLLDQITGTSMLYSAEKEVEDFIKSKILDSMPSFEKSSEAIKYVKTKVKELFVCENKAPYWAQNCEWPFDKKGNPMKFISQKRTGEKVEYVFTDTVTDEKKTVVQFY